MGYGRVSTYPGVSCEISDIYAEEIYEPNIGCGAFNLLRNKEDVIKEYSEVALEHGLEKVMYITNFSDNDMQRLLEKYFDEAKVVNVDVKSYKNEFNKRINKTNFPKEDVEKIKNYMKKEDTTVIHSITVTDPEIPEEIKREIMREKYNTVFSKTFATLFGINKKYILSALFGDRERFIGYAPSIESLRELFQDREEMLTLKKGNEKYAGGNNTLAITYKDLENKNLKEFVDKEGVLVYSFTPGLVVKHKNRYSFCAHYRALIPNNDLTGMCIKIPFFTELDISKSQNLEDALKEKLTKRSIKSRTELMNSSSGKAFFVTYEKIGEKLTPTQFFEGKKRIEGSIHDFNLEIADLKENTFYNISEYETVELLGNNGKLLTIEIQEKLNEIISKSPDAANIIESFEEIESIYFEAKKNEEILSHKEISREARKIL